MSRLSYLSESLDNPNVTPQDQPIPDETQVQNKAGGFVYAVDKWSQLQRFLILGTEGGTYYATEKDQTREQSHNLLACIAEDGLRTVRVITEISQDGRAPKNDPAIYALALASIKGDEATRKAAHDALPLVCRIGTHLFLFAELRDQLGGWGRGVRRAVGNWYTQREADQLAYQLIKYRQRGGWTHRDLLRLAHPKSPDADVNAALRWAVKAMTHGGMSQETLAEHFPGLPEKIRAFELAQGAKTPADTAKLVVEHGLPREALKTEHLASLDVWDAMLHSGGKHGMPVGALVRNLATMTRIGLLDGSNAATQKVIDTLTSMDALKHARIHPMGVLFALKTYAAGHSVRGSHTWAPLPRVVDALDEAFYLAFGNVEATGKRRMIALDISGSMWGGYGGWVGGIPNFSAAQAAAAMSLVSMKTGDPYEVVAFASAGRDHPPRWYGRQHSGSGPTELIPGLSAMNLSARQRLDDVDKAMHAMSAYMGGTDAALPCIYAEKTGKEIDVFEVYTDNETWAGSIHPSQALRSYRQKSGIDAKLVSIGMTATESSIADPNDAGMLDVVGFDTAAPNLISAFVQGQF
jgi:60 kDa SS-A/Ro ribonucleoprotein